MSVDFWTSIGDAYRIFSAYCRYDDWQHILNVLADRIVQINDRTSSCILDVGCGLGRNTLSISEALFTRTGHRPIVDIVEPSLLARSTVQNLIPTHSQGGFLRSEYGSIGELDKREYDAVLFLHSTYYINQLQEQLSVLTKKHLRTDGKLLFLVLPGTSPFFIRSQRLPNTAERLELMLDELHLARQSLSLSSRFLFGHKHLLTTETVSSLRRFMNCEDMTDEEFCDVLLQKANRGEIDFGDRLIIAGRV